MYEEQKKLLEYHLKKLNNEYARANTLSKKKKIASQLKTFEDLCFYELFDFVDISKIDWLEDEQIHNIGNYNVKKFIDKIQSNNEFYNRLSKKVIDTYTKLEYPFYKDYYKSGLISCYKNLPEKEIEKTLMDFTEEYDEEWLKVIINKNIFLSDAEEYGGKVSLFPSLQDTYMFLSSSWEKSIVFYASAAHEYGHLYEINQDFKSKNFNYQHAYRYSEFGEVSSVFFEYAFLMYLKKHKLYEDVVDCYLKYCYFIPMFEEFVSINLLTRIEGYEDSVILTDKTLLDELNNIKEKANYYDFFKDKVKISYRRTYLYGLAKLIAIYLYDNYEQNPEKFKKEFRNSLLTYPITNDLSSFNNVGVSQEELLRCKKLIKVINEQNK